MDLLQAHSNHPTWQMLENTKNLYQYPISTQDKTAIASGQALADGIPPEQLRMVGPFWVASSPQSHIGPFLNAIDFLVCDGTSVLAAHDGRIIEVVESSAEWGDGEEFRDKLNYLTIEHFTSSGTCEFSQYCHLMRNSVSANGLRVGSIVRAGQMIAKVGKTGWTDRDHLHFIVFRGEVHTEENPFGFRSLIVNFQ